MHDSQREQVGLFRFGVIGPLVSGELAHGELKARIRQLCSRRYTIPFSQKTTIGFGTIEQWLHNYRTRGIDGLMPAVRNDKGSVRRIRPELKEAIIEMKRQHPKRSLRSILNHLVKNNLMKPNEITKSTGYRILGNALPQRQPSITGKQQKRFVHRYPNQCWQGDVMHGPYIKDAKSGRATKTYLVAFIDDASRLIVGGRFFFEENAANVKTVLREAVLTYGVPAKLYVDNGRPFCSEDLRIACAKMSTALIQIAVELGVIPMFKKSDVARQVINAIAEFYVQQKVVVVLVIDEAHLLKPEILDEIRLIHNSDYDSNDYLATALVGQPPLKKMIAYNKFIPLRQRISVAYHLKPLSKNDSYNYFDHQIALAKAQVKIFMDNAVETIITTAKGTPRMINTIALKAMIFAAQNKMTTVDQECVLKVLDELGLK